MAGQKVVGLLEIAAQTATELARVDATDDTRERLRAHIDTFLSTTHVRIAGVIVIAFLFFLCAVAMIAR
jgi:hypothetical protein